MFFLAVAVVAGAFVVWGRTDAEAAPKAKPTRASILDDAGAAAAPDAAPVDASAARAVHASDADAVESPVDVAIAPDGGVPYHPQGTTYRSPFAKPFSTGPVRATISLKLNSVDDYDVKTGIFSADFFLSLTSASPMPSMELMFPNGQLEQKEVIADRPTFKLYRMTGKFKSPPDLRKYPFDTQKLTIQIEDDRNGIDQVRFVPDEQRTDLSRGFRVLGWSVLYAEGRSFSHSYERFEGDDLYYNRYVFELGVERFGTSAAFKVFVPALVIVIIALLGMWVPPEEMEVRSNSGAPMLAGAVLFHFALMQELPATSYLTRADKLMLGVYLSLLLGMISTWWMFLVKEENMAVVFRVARWVVPIVSVVVMALSMTW